jgi:hypothetical protein
LGNTIKTVDYHHLDMPSRDFIVEHGIDWIHVGLEIGQITADLCPNLFQMTIPKPLTILLHISVHLQQMGKFGPFKKSRKFFRHIQNWLKGLLEEG